MSSSESKSRSAHFAQVASTYDELRTPDGWWWETYEAIAAAGDLRGRRVLDIGCGTGQLARALAEREVARVWGVDASPQMAEVARANGVNVKVAAAERLPFKDGWFERAVSRMAVHLFDRPRAFAELRRVLAADGVGVIATMDPAWFERHWLLPWFAEAIERDTERFPSADALTQELGIAGFDVEIRRLEHDASVTRDEALARIRGRAYSTFDLVSDEAHAAALARAEAEFPERVDYRPAWLIAVVRPPGGLL
jgi:ubiquinone/menaquinone biosynthesis C-methylase UbiE